MTFGRYLKTKYRAVLLYLLSFVLLLFSFAMFRLPLAAVYYPMLLTACFAIPFILWDYRAARKRTKELACLQKELERLNGLLVEEKQQSDRRLDYYSVWAHQIKTPIASMRVKLQEQDSDLSRRISIDLDHIDRYADMVMTYLRLDGDGTDYVFRRIDLDDVVRAAVRKFSGEFIAKRLRLSYDSVHLQVLTDEKWLGFVVEQILSNALKYTQRGGIRITLEQPGTLIICDTGIGIAAEDLPRIFERGYTGCNGRRDKKASGIGLYLCRRICEGLGHGIAVSSSVGEGTQVRLSLWSKDIETQD